MQNKWIQRLTLALAAVALFAAAGGPSYAAKKVKTISGTKIKKNSISETKLTAAARASLKGNAGPQGPKGADGANGSAVAYAAINADGTVVANLSKNVTNANVVKEGTGEYCFRNVPGATTALVNPNGFGPDADNFASLTVFDSSSICNTITGEQTRVLTYNTPADATSGTETDQPFYIWFN